MTSRSQLAVTLRTSFTFFTRGGSSTLCSCCSSLSVGCEQVSFVPRGKILRRRCQLGTLKPHCITRVARVTSPVIFHKCFGGPLRHNWRSNSILLALSKLFYRFYNLYSVVVKNIKNSQRKTCVGCYSPLLTIHRSKRNRPCWWVMETGLKLEPLDAARCITQCCRESAVAQLPIT